MAALRKEAKELDALLGTLPAGSAEAAAALQRLADVRADMKDFRETLANMDAGERLKGVVGIANGVAGAFSVATVAAREFGLSGGSLEEYTSKVTSLIAVVQGLDAFREALEPKSWAGLKVIFTNLTAGLASVRQGFSLSAISARVSSLTIRQALLATGIGAIVVLIGVLLANFDKVKEAGQAIYQRFKPAFDGIAAVFNKVADAARNIGSALTGGLIDNAAQARQAATAAAAGVQLEFEKALLESDARIAKARAANAKAQLAADIVIAERREELAKQDYQLAVAAFNRKRNLSTEQLRDETKKLADLEAAQVEASRKRVDAQQAFDDFQNKRFQKQQDTEIALIKDETTRKVAELRAAGQREIAELERQGGDVTKLRSLILQRVEREVADVQKKAAEEARKKAKETADKAKADAEKAAKERLEVEQNIARLLVANIQDETLQKLDVLDEQAQEEKAKVKGTEEQKALQIKLIDEKLARDRSKVLADSEKDRLKAIEDAAEKELEVFKAATQRRLDLEAALAASTDTLSDDRDAAISRLAAEQELELRAAEKTGADKAAILKRYEQLIAQTREDFQQQGFQRDQQRLDQLASYVNQITGTLLQASTDALDAQLTELQDRLSILDSQIKDKQSAIERDEQALADAKGARREFLIKRIEQERKAETALAKERQAAAEKEKQAEQEKQKLQKIGLQITAAESLAKATLLGVQLAQAIAEAASKGKFGFDNVALALAMTAALVTGVTTVKAAAKLEDGGLLVGPSHAEGGIRGTGRFANVEVEGGEMVINKWSTARFLPLLEQINAAGRTRYLPAPGKMATGGVLTAPAAASGGLGNGEVVEVLTRIEGRLVAVESAVLRAPQLAPKPVLRIGTVEAEAISEQQAAAAEQKALATF